MKGGFSLAGIVAIAVVIFALYSIASAFKSDGGGAKGCFAAAGVAGFILLVLIVSILGSIF